MSASRTDRVEFHRSTPLRPLSPKMIAAVKNAEVVSRSIWRKELS
jgi:hypothetical protein